MAKINLYLILTLSGILLNVAGAAFAQAQEDSLEALIETGNTPVRHDTLNDHLTDWFATIGKKREEKAAILQKRKAVRDAAWAKKQVMINHSSAFEQFSDWVFTLHLSEDKRFEERVRLNANRGQQKAYRRANNDDKEYDYFKEEEKRKRDLQKYQDNLGAKDEAQKRLQKANRGWDASMKQMDVNKRQIKQNINN